MPADAPSPTAPAGSADPAAAPGAVDPGLVMGLAELEKRLDAFQRDGLRTKSAETVGTYRRTLHEFVRWFATQQGRVRFSTDDVERYKAFLMTERGLSQVSVSTYLTALRRFLSYLVDIGLIAENPARAVKGNRRPASHTRSVLTQGEVDALLDGLPRASVLDLRDRALVLLMLRAGLAEIELVRADVKDFDATLMGHVLRVQGKGHTVKDQQVDVDAGAADAVAAYLGARGRVTPDAPLFASHGRRSDGERLNTRSVRTRIGALLKGAGIRRPGVTPHSLTHTAALLWLASGVPVDEVRRRMRHGTLDTTMIYVRQTGLLKKSPEELTRLLREA